MVAVGGGVSVGSVSPREVSMAKVNCGTSGWVLSVETSWSSIPVPISGAGLLETTSLARSCGKKERKVGEC